MFCREAFTTNAAVVFDAEPLVSAYFSYYYALFCYVGLGWTYTQRRTHASKRAMDVELQWFGIASFYTHFDLPDIAGGTVGWSLNKYRPHLSKWRQSKYYYLWQLCLWPLQCLFDEMSLDENHYVARLRRDLYYPDLRVCTRFPYPNNYQDNVWTHNIHAMVSKSHYIFFNAVRSAYGFDDKGHFLDMATKAEPPVPTTCNLDVPEGTIALVFIRNGGDVPEGLTLNGNGNAMDLNRMLYVKHVSLEMGAGVHPLNVSDAKDAWKVYAVSEIDSTVFQQDDLDWNEVKLFELASAGGDFVVQPALLNCDKIKEWCTKDAPLCSFRVITTCLAGLQGSESKVFHSTGEPSEEQKKLKRDF
jgi:hypothetical protein